MPPNSDVSVTLRQVSPKELAESWHLVRPGLQRALDNSANEFCLSTVCQCLERGELGLLFVYVDEEYAGFMTTETIYTDRGKWLSLPYAYSTPPKERKGPPDLMLPSLKVVEKIAQMAGYLGVKFVASRKGYKRIAPKGGYRPRMIEYVKEF